MAEPRRLAAAALLVLSLPSLLASPALGQAVTPTPGKLMQWGMVRPSGAAASVPDTVCAYDRQGVCQTIGSLPQSGGPFIYPAANLFAQGQQPEPTAAFGGVYGWEGMSDPTTYTGFRGTQVGTLYIHGSALQPTLFGSTNTAIGKTTPTIIEISFGGGFQPSYFTGGTYASGLAGNFSPTVAVVNIDNTGFTGAFANPAYSTGYPLHPYNPTQAQISQGAAGNADVDDWAAYLSAGRAAGLKVMAPVVSPNACGGSTGNCSSTAASDNASPYVAHPWCINGTSGATCVDDGWWTGVKQMALQGGGIALDSPPAFYLHVLPDDVQRNAYLQHNIQVMKWAQANKIWSGIVDSPQAYSGITPATSKYMTDVQTTYYQMWSAGALPNVWIAENYEFCGPKFAFTNDTLAAAAAQGATSISVNVGSDVVGLNTIVAADTFTMPNDATVYTASNSVSGSNQTLNFTPALAAAQANGATFSSTPACHASAGSPVGPETQQNSQAAAGLWLARNAATAPYLGSFAPLLAPSASNTSLTAINGHTGPFSPGYGGLNGAGSLGSQDLMNPYLGQVTTGRGQQNQNQVRGSNIGLPAGIVAQGDDTNIGQILAPKGNGGLSGSVPDGTAAGGNLVGPYATDWQRVRSLASQIASGTYSTLSGGVGNAATAPFSTVSGGNANVASGQGAAVLGGEVNSATGTHGQAGGIQANDQGRDATRVFSAGQNGGRISQIVDAILRNTSSSTSAVRLTSNAAAAGSTNCLNLQPGTVLAFSAILSGRDGFANSYVWSLPAAQLRQDAGPSTTTYTASSTAPSTAAIGSAAAPAITLSADTTNGCLSATVTPPNADAWTWSMRITGMEQQ